MIQSGQTWYGMVVTKDATGALSAGVGTAGALYVNGVVNAAAVAIAGANPYSWTVTLPVLARGDCVSMYITSTIGGIATASVVKEDVCSVVQIDANGAVGVSAISANTITAASMDATASAEIADAVWDELIAGHLGAGSTGATLNAATPGAPIVLNSEITEVHVT